MKPLAFRWRHRFLRYALTTRVAQLAGNIEADEVFTPELFKGRRRLSQPARLHESEITDMYHWYASFARSQGLSHQVLHHRAGQRVKAGAYHIQHMNGFHRRLKEWMERFHGVATSYLKNYLGWWRMLERYQRAIDVRYCLHQALGRP